MDGGLLMAATNLLPAAIYSAGESVVEPAGGRRRCRTEAAERATLALRRRGAVGGADTMQQLPPHCVAGFQFATGFDSTTPPVD